MMKHYTIIYCMLIIMPYSLLSQVTISDSLLNKSEMLKLNGKFGFSQGPLQKISFGTFKTVDINKGRRHFVGRQKDAYFDIEGKNTGFKRSTGKITSQPFSLIIKEDADTIISNMDIITVRGGNHALVEINRGKSTDDESSVSYCKDIVIQTRTDTLYWHMPQNNDEQTDDPDFPLSYDAVLSNGVHNILAKGADGFPVKRKSFMNATKGIVFLDNKKQIAALETYPDTTIWFSNDISERYKQVIAASIISLLSISKQIY